MPSVRIGHRVAGPQSEQYIISDFLGRGAFGEVYRAASESTGNVVAVKLLPVGQLTDDTSRQALFNEMRAAHQIDHPNVVRVLHVDEGTNPDLGPYAVMEYVSGGTLARLLRVQNQTKTQIPISRALEMMIDIAQGTRAINQKLIHRDIKPDNILVEDKFLKIGDFGISKFVDESTRLHTFKGGQHIAYMAPEGWAAEKNTFKLDVYAVGLVFFEILTLAHPFLLKVKDPGSPRDWERAHLYEVLPDLRNLRNEVPLSLVQLVSRMAAKRPQDRPDWDEVLKILSDPALEPDRPQSKVVSQAVASALAKRQQNDKQSLESARKADELNTQRLLYSHSSEALLQSFQPPLDQFNREFQFGKIEVRKDFAATYYMLPGGNAIEVSFFEPQRTGIKIRNGVVIGGGWIGLKKGRSANLVLLRYGDDDLYGRWIVCEISLMALVDPRKIIGRFGITENTIQPFGFKDAYFYEQIAYAQGGLHAFTYSFIDDVQGHFGNLLAEGCK